jgi:hypothetical protein
MNLKENQEIKRIIEGLEEGMIDYISEDTSYTKKDVAKCMQILNQYLESIAVTKTKDEGMAVVEKTVLELNELNEACEHELIETGQREDICEIIIIAGNLLGYNDMDDDITEEWREW